ncbi:unnamed protein product [Sphenostylis stenocarpa]|uniref:Uncharacterized protein n=1 Tax=Sphenostylis stenocarpa TaxID=92480 RepID=A0AA86S090_9FABA|nr:unnamed protein product [Sphenostylis stenocarpa]
MNHTCKVKSRADHFLYSEKKLIICTLTDLPCPIGHMDLLFIPYVEDQVARFKVRAKLHVAPLDMAAKLKGIEGKGWRCYCSLLKSAPIVNVSDESEGGQARGSAPIKYENLPRFVQG